MPVVHTHYCWVTPRQRVKRVGRAVDCHACHRWENKHRCGGRAVFSSALLDYGVQDCAVCDGRFEQGEFPTEVKPATRVVRPRIRKVKQPSWDRLSKIDRWRKRADCRATQRRRQTLIVLAVSRGYVTVRQISQLLIRFGVKTFHRDLLKELYKLVGEHFLVMIRVEREKTRAYQSGYMWHFQLNPAVEERLDANDM
jgi:hypothetical protein